MADPVTSPDSGSTAVSPTCDRTGESGEHEECREDAEDDHRNRDVARVCGCEVLEHGRRGRRSEQRRTGLRGRR